MRGTYTQRLKGRQHGRCERRRQTGHGHERNKRKSMCFICGGSGLCLHNKRKNECKDCNPDIICQHNINKINCIECTPSKKCIHNKRKKNCKICNVKKNNKCFLSEDLINYENYINNYGYK